MSKRKVVGGDSSGASQHAAPSSQKEQKLAMRVCNAKRAGKLSAGEEAELAARGEKDSELAAMSRNDCAMRDVRDLGRRPKESVKSPPKERRLATRLRKAKRRGKQSEEQKEELAAMSAREVGTLEQVDLPPDPRDPFADMADNRLEQDLLMVRNGINRKKVLQRMIRYKKYLTHPGACIVIVEKYKDKVFQALLGHRLAMSAASQLAPPGATKSRASRSCASLPPSRKAKRSRHAVGGA